MKIKLLITFLCISNILTAQFLGAEEINSNELSAWTVNDLKQYEGLYHFGVSEEESLLYLCFSENIWTAQIRWGEFDASGTQWINKFKNLTNVKIKADGSFSSKEHSGTFLKYKNESYNSPVLKINNPWTKWINKGSFEIGSQQEIELSKIYYGKYPDTSYKIISLDILKSQTKEELQLMRNEIYARYGHKFAKGGKMATYFGQQDWYRPYYENVYAFLTEIEKKNISQISQVEKLITKN